MSALIKATSIGLWIGLITCFVWAFRAPKPVTANSDRQAMAQQLDESMSFIPKEGK